MGYSVEDLEDQKRFRLFMTISYKDLIQFVFDYLKKKSVLLFSFGLLSLIFLSLTTYIRIDLAGRFPESWILFHTLLGMVILPLVFIPIHEFLHIIPYFLSGARKIRIGMDLRQYLFYVTAHRYVASPAQFWVVALMPFIIISTGLLIGVFLLPGLWKWSLSMFLFVHATMCAGDFALLNLYYLNKDMKIFTWDDADKKEAYFYEKLN